MLHTFFSAALLTMTFAGSFVDEANETCRVTRFTGQISRDVGDEQLVIRDFEVLLLQGKTEFFHVLDDEQEGCPWPESFGQVNQTGQQSPRLIIRYEQLPYSIPLPQLSVQLPESIDDGTSWDSENWQFEFDGQDETEDGRVWLVNGREQRGRQQRLRVDAETGLTREARMDVFMGQGDQFELRLVQTSSRASDAQQTNRISQTIERLLNLQSKLGRRADTQQRELSVRQVGLAEADLSAISDLAADTPLAETAFRIRQDIDRQKRRIRNMMTRRQQLLSKKAPSFSLDLSSGGRLTSAELAGKTTVLHFWDYSDKALSEPYGQVGYLEFLFNQKRGDDQFAVVGVATNSRLLDPERNRAARRSTRKLIEFMNLSYPVGFDDGTLIRSLGDPRESGGQLPLWIIISKEGTVLHYHTGFYEVDRNSGLKQLMEALGTSTD